MPGGGEESGFDYGGPQSAQYAAHQSHSEKSGVQREQAEYQNDHGKWKGSL